MTNEVWKDIKGFEGKYQISNLGRVKSLYFRNGKTTIKREKIMTIQTTGNYDHIMLAKDNKQINYLIHRLVAQAFVGNPSNYDEINHKDENTRNNNANNLEWCDHKYNINYGERTKKVKEKMQKPIAQYNMNGELIKKWDCMNDAIREYKNKHILDVCKGTRKSASNYIWKYILEK